MFNFQTAEVLYFGRKLTAHQAEQTGFVTKVFPEATFQSELQAKLAEYAKLPPKVISIAF